MSPTLPAGPLRTVTLDDGTEAPFYVIPFDKRGVCEAPATRQHLLDQLAGAPGDGPQFTDVFVFSHGWNNVWKDALERYEHFLAGYSKMRLERGLPVPDGYRPLLVGIFWPSASLAVGRKEKGPDMAAGGARDEERMGEELAAVRELAAELPAEEAERFMELLSKPELGRDEALELARLASVLYAEDEELSAAPPASAEEIVELWTAAAEADAPPALGEFGTLGGTAAGPQAAGLGSIFKALDPRNIVRGLSLYQMKDRAGQVGARGVGPLLRELLAGDARIHLVGHSFGGKLMLSAVTVGDPLPRKVHSMLLLQPAVSHLCFAPAGEIRGTDQAGGYRPALARVERPILATFSRHDLPLSKLFHNAVRRKGDLGEAKIAAPGEPPSRFAALGGYGPRRSGERLIPIRDPGEPYDLDPAVPVYGVDGERTIGGHGDISNESTWWALYTLAAG